MGRKSRYWNAEELALAHGFYLDENIQRLWDEWRKSGLRSDLPVVENGELWVKLRERSAWRQMKRHPFAGTYMLPSGKWAAQYWNGTRYVYLKAYGTRREAVVAGRAMTRPRLGGLAHLLEELPLPEN